MRPTPSRLWNRYQGGEAIQLGEGLADRGVIITGAASGIGRAALQLLAEAGARVYAVDRDSSGLDSLLAQLPGGPDRHVGRVVDLADTQTLEPMVADAVAAFGGIRALINVAALLRRESIEDVSAQSWDQHVDVNLKATFFLCRAAAAAMTASGGGGRIVNFTARPGRSDRFTAAMCMWRPRRVSSR